MIGGGVLGLLEQGGTVMLPLLLCSVIAVAIVLERIWTLTREARSARHVHALVYQALAGAGRTAALYPGSWSQWSNLDLPVETT